MAKTKKLNLITCFVAILTLLLGVGFFLAPEKTALAENTTYTVVFKKGGSGDSSAEVIEAATLTLNEGEAVLERDINFATEHLPQVENGRYIWFYSIDNGKTLVKATITGDGNREVVKNVKNNIMFWAYFQDTSDRHKVTFIMPDQTVITKTVADGDTVDAPIPELGFCERVKYDKSLDNIKEDMTVTVTIDNTLKFVFMAGCGALLVTSIVVIVVIIFRALKLPDDDDEDGLVEMAAADDKNTDPSGIGEDNH